MCIESLGRKPILVSIVFVDDEFREIHSRVYGKTQQDVRFLYVQLTVQ